MSLSITATPALASLVLESNNLRGGENDLETVTASLIRVLKQLSQQTMPLSELEAVIVTHDNLPQHALEAIHTESHITNLRFVAIEETEGYYRAKNIGFEHTDTEVVVFADADCEPKEEWLQHLLLPFYQAQEQQTELPPAVAGRTTYHNSILGTAISTMDFIYYKSPVQKGAVRNFYANNVAFRRDIYQQYHFDQHQTIFRGHCQIVGMELTHNHVPILFQNKAHTIHSFPDTTAELLRLRLLRGQDTVSLTPYFVDAALPASLGWMKKLLPLNLLIIFTLRPIIGLWQINRQDMASISGFRYLACVFNIGLVNAIDATGALLRLLGLSPLGKVDDGELLAMSYHKK